jgi:hypothetical protein
MDFVRFSGELFIYYVLIALGGGVLTGLTLMLFGAIEMSVERLVQSWIIPCGAAGAVIVAAWLVEAKQNVAESLAPMPSRSRQSQAASPSSASCRIAWPRSARTSFCS